MIHFLLKNALQLITKIEKVLNFELTSFLILFLKHKFLERNNKCNVLACRLLEPKARRRQTTQLSGCKHKNVEMKVMKMISMIDH